MERKLRIIADKHDKQLHNARQSFNTSNGLKRQSGKLKKKAETTHRRNKSISPHLEPGIQVMRVEKSSDDTIALQKKQTKDAPPRGRPPKYRKALLEETPCLKSTEKSKEFQKSDEKSKENVSPQPGPSGSQIQDDISLREKPDSKVLEKNDFQKSTKRRIPLPEFLSKIDDFFVKIALDFKKISLDFKAFRDEYEVQYEVGSYDSS